MKEEDIQKILSNLSDSEKFRLLYRIELVDLNKRLSGILAKTGAKGDAYSSRRREIYHKFFDGNGANAGNHKQMEIRLANLKVSVIEYFDAKTMFAYALFLRVLTSEYFNTFDFNTSLEKAIKTLRKYFILNIKNKSINQRNNSYNCYIDLEIKKIR